MSSKCPSCGSPTREEESQCSTCGWDFVAHKRLPKPAATPPPAEGFSLPAARNLNVDPDILDLDAEPAPAPLPPMASLPPVAAAPPAAPRPAASAPTIAPPPGAAVPPPAGMAPPPVRLPGAATAGGRKRILIVEDEPGYQELMESLLIAGPFELTICGSVEEATVKIDTEVFDMIITDINLLGLTGFEVLAKIKAQNRLEECPVVMCSSQFDEETKEQALGMGAAGFIPKPYQYDMVLSTVKAMLGVQF
jgi:CheY-like chemotaxis protein